MRSSNGDHWLALDQIRAFAAFLVFCWHFLHGANGTPIPFTAATPAFVPLALFDEGQTGVALFMTLSGYLFAKLLGAADIRIGAFLWNRMVRLLPVAGLVVAAVLVQNFLSGGLPSVEIELFDLWVGLLDPTMPLEHGLWSIMVEVHFYILLPLLLAAQRKIPVAPLLMVAAAVALRLALALQGKDVAFLAYWTIIGRIDQFALGMAAFHYRRHIVGRTGLALVIATVFVLFYAAIDVPGASHRNGAPHGNLLWTFLPTIEGAAYASLIAWYDARPQAKPGFIGRSIGAAGTWSYSLYLLHFFVVFRMAAWIDAHVMPLGSLPVALCWSIICFVALWPVGWTCFYFVERPFLRLRRPYRRVPEAFCGQALAIA